MGQRDELSAHVTVLWRPALDRPPLEAKWQYWNIAVIEVAQLFSIFRSAEHGFARLALFRHISPLSR